MTAQARGARSRGPRERVVFSAMQLIRRRGVSGTGLREVTAQAQAPWGSLQHYFPGGKDQIVTEALECAGRYAARRIERYMGEADLPTPSGLLTCMIDQWRKEFRSDGFDGGCPIVAAAADVAATNDGLRGAMNAAFDRWMTPLTEALRQMGVPSDRAASLAMLILSSIEGAIVLARTRQELTPLDIVLAELSPVLDGAVSPAAAHLSGR